MNRTYRPLATFLSIVWLLALLAAALPAPGVRAASGPMTVELEAIADARVQGGSPDNGFGNGFIWVGTLNGHLAYVQFDLQELPANATISSAELRLSFTGVYTPAANVEVGRNDSAWDEDTVTWNTRPTSTFGGPIQPVGDTAGDISWSVTPLVNQWHGGARPNYGFALRGDGPLKAFHSRETTAGSPPRLRITYTVPPPEGARPDLGDAPDTTNNVGIPNTAYPGVNGNFPTVWNGTPAGQPFGPRHANPTGEGILGLNLSRENEADNGPDEDGVNNILNGGADNADNDRGDDGWRNRNVAFPHCEPTTLRVRVSKPQGATLNKMYLNVWFDGTNDGDWDDRGPCAPENETLQIPATEWIVQDYIVDMTGIPAGGFVDIDINTETVLNTTPRKRHWMRFMLSEERAVRTPGNRADGRGPQSGYQFGETEDVLQRPQPPGEDGTLELQKQVITGGEPVDWFDYVTYQIRLRHNGGSQPIQAQIRDELDYPLIVYPTINSSGISYVDVTSATGGATPLQANLEILPPQGSTPPRQVVTWRGALAPNAEIVLSFQVRVLNLCEPNEQTRTITNRAQARPRGGDPITAEDSFVAKCIGYTGSNIELSPNPIADPIDLEDLTQVPWSGEIWNRHPFTVTIGLYQTGITTIIQDSTDLVETVTLGPNERRQISLNLPLGQENGNPLDQTGDPTPIRVGFCFLFADNPSCPDAQRYPHYHGEAPPVSVTPRANDLGDAPDSSNHAGAAMAAYPGVQASFPTVFDPATGLPEGPRHAHPRPFHLGQRVSLEAEADVGPDQDPTNNIIPAANTPNRDRYDDGARLLGLAHCQPATAEVKVFISPQAAAWFQQQNKPAYLNAWVDGNRDGDWNDGTSCGGGPDGGGPGAVEHILIDQPINVAALGAGLHTLTFQTGRALWPAQLAERPAWLRFTLSERESNKTLQYGNIKYGDGRGYDKPFRTGETEDYLLRAAGDPDAAPDLGVQLSGRIVRGGGQSGNDQIGFKLEYANVGSLPATGASLVFRKPAQLRDIEIILLRAPGIPAQGVVETGETVTIALPDLAPGADGTILLGWEAPPNQAPAGDYSASLVAQLTADSVPDNNQDSLTLARPPFVPSVAIVAGNGTAWGMAETTCRSNIELTGVTTPGMPFDLWIDGVNVASLVSNVTPYLHPRSNLSNGRHELWVTPNAVTDPALRSESLRLNVDTSLPIDPLSLTFTDSQGRSYHPSTLNWRQLGSQVAAFLRAGETYELGIDSCSSNLNQQIDIQLPNGDLISMIDLDGDGRYTGTLVFDESGSINSSSATLAAASELSLVVSGGSSRQVFPFSIQAQPRGTVRDAATGQPLAGASVTALSGAGVAWPASALGQPNPQTTGADGSYSFNAPGSASRLAVTRDGYQPYTSTDLAADSGALAQDIALTPEFSGTPAQTIYVTESGFSPAVVRVPAGSVIEWVNMGLEEHAAAGAAWDSGILAAGQRYRVRLSTAGTYSYADSASPLSAATIIVEGGSGAGNKLFLPLVAR